MAVKPVVVVTVMAVMPVRPRVTVAAVMGEHHAVVAAGHHGRGPEVRRGGRLGRRHEQPGEQR